MEKKSMLCSITTFSEDSGKLFLRLTLAFAMIPHGAQKVFGLFNGSGLQATWQSFTQGLGISPTWTAIAIGTEFFAPLFLILGIFTRFWATALAILMIVAMQYHLDSGYFINWKGNQNGEGYEYHLLYIGAAIALILLGGGRFAFLRPSKKSCTCGCCSACVPAPACESPQEPSAENK